MVETGFVRPDAALVDELATEALRAAGAPVDQRVWSRIDHGSVNLIVLSGDVAVRVTRTPDSVHDLLRTQRLVDRLPDLPFAVPRSVAAPVLLGGIAAVAQRRVPGAPHPSGGGDPGQLRTVLDAIHGVPLDPLSDDLAPARSYMGGARWFEVMTDQAIPLLAQDAQAPARRAADALAALDPVSPVLVHGDLAGANVLWEDGRISGVLDWDLASADDPAADVAALGNWHGWEQLSEAADPQLVERAKAFAATYPLQVICFALLNARPLGEVARAVAAANARLAS
ncbi:phosphotransferase family protein [Leifsonia sp. Le1]|uniref:phosphotransferase family protein n=1 Tax=Leifsonia sp. Le1 TaxID=3404918 RepID=UPI003EBDDAA7